MSEITGITISVLHFLNNQPAYYQIIRNECTVEFCLKEGRKYLVPEYQREIRWDRKQLMRLMFDIDNHKDFLGHIILDQSGKNFEIVDGQQRITILYLLIHCIKSKLEGEDLEFEPCPLYNASYSRFSDALVCGFDPDAFPAKQKEAILASDWFCQNERYRQLWNIMLNCDYFSTPSRCKDFLTKLKQCKLNVSKTNSDSIDHGIEYFLDVNLKGVGLDAEDTFKAQLFNLGAGDEIRELWVSLKRKAFRLNSGTHRNCYPLMLLLEHWLTCNLYSEKRFREVHFNSDFRITDEVELDAGDRRYPGEHIISVIDKQSYMKRCLREVIEVIDVLLELVENPSYPGSFGQRFPATGKEVSTHTITIIFNLLKKVVWDSERIPKILIFKYIQEVLLRPGKKRAQEYEKCYAIYTLDVLFSIFAKKKSKGKIYSLVRDDRWYENVVMQVKSYFSTTEISRRRLEASYYASGCGDGQDEPEHNDLYRCKSLATLYNFLSFHKAGLIYQSHGELYRFLEEEEAYSAEHLILNKSGTCDVLYGGKTYCYPYPRSMKKYLNSLFNFVFIPRTLNETLKNKPLAEKLSILAGEPLTCEYSNMILQILPACFHVPDCSHLTTEKDIKKCLDNYYIHTFAEEYVAFAQKVVAAFFDRW